MKNYTEVQVINNVISSTVCNCCGKEIKPAIYDMNNYVETINIRHSFGYFSKLFYDGEDHDLDVCEDCYMNWIKSFKIAP
jgi:protein-arginine kinase activator protein McsA